MRLILSIRAFLLLSFAVGCAFLAPAAAQAQAPPASPTGPVTQAQIAYLKQTITAAQSSADNAWMLTSSALVLMMTGPGLALFYCGLVRKKNVLSVIMQCIFLMCLMTVLWALYGYTLAFGGTNEPGTPAWIGTTKYLFMNNAQAQWDTATNSS